MPAAAGGEPIAMAQHSADQRTYNLSITYLLIYYYNCYV